MLFSSWWEDLERPHRLFDQHFGLSLSPDELPSALAPFDSDVLVLRPRRRGGRRYQPYDRAVERKTAGTSTVQADKDKFQVTLDVQQFAPEEVTVKVVDRNVVIEGKHEEKQDEHGWISRQFVRKYLVPEQCDIDQIQSSLSSDGVLMITAPRKESEPKNERIIKIQTTRQPALREDTKSNEAQKDQQQTSPQKSVSQQRGQKEQTVKAA